MFREREIEAQLRRMKLRTLADVCEIRLQDDVTTLEVRFEG